MAIVERPGGLVPASPPPPPEQPPAASFDIRLPWPLGPSFLAAGLLGAVLFVMLTAALGSPIYHGDAQFLVVRLGSTNNSGIQIIDRRISAIGAIARSDPFMIELKRESGVDATVAELSDMVTATRPNFGAIVLVTVTGTNQQEVQLLTQHIPSALSATIDLYRKGLVPLLNDNDRALVPGLTEADGPLYLQLFDQPSIPDSGVTETSPRVLLMSLVGFGVGIVALAVVAALFHERMRITSAEDIEELLETDQLGGIPRPRGKGGRHAGRMMLGFANEVASLQEGDRYAVGIVGSGLPRLLRRTARTLAAASAAVTGEPVVYVDLDDRRRSLLAKRRTGVLDVAGADDAALGAACRPLKWWSLPRWAWRFGRGVPIRQIGLGRARPPGVDVEEAMASVVARLAEHHVVVVGLPRVPGPTPVGSTLAKLDVGLVMLLDGWTGLEDAQVVADAAHAGVAGPVCLFLIEN